MFKEYDMEVDDEYIFNKFKEGHCWGIETLVNLKACDLEKVKSGDVIKQFIIDLCDVIKMERYGDTVLERFGSGHLYGYSAMQLIRTSSIVIHLAEEDGRVFLDIWSCKEFKPGVAATFCATYFGAKDYDYMTILRD
jgi:S-adenosylmethionine/arginine decarboxylase-like enzyme